MADEPMRPAFDGVVPGDAPALVDELRATVLESYRALTGGYEDAWREGLARDDSLVLLDVAPDSVVIGFDPRKPVLHRPFADRTLAIVSKALEIHLSRDRSVGWTYDELSYRITHAGRRAILPLRATSVYERRDGAWVLVQQHVSYGIEDEDAFAAAVEGRLVDPAPIPDAAMGPGAAEVRAIVLDLLRDDGDARDRYVSREPIALVVASDPDREKRGAQVAEAPTVRALFHYEYEVRLGGVRVTVSRSGTVGWAAANVFIVGSREGRTFRLPLRVTLVLEKRPAGWRLLQTHASVPITERALALEAFGEEDERGRRFVP